MKFNEKEMRESKAASPKTEEELCEYIKSLGGEGDHDYGTCVYAVSLATVATFNLMAHKLGITGFQASCADLDALKRIRRYEDGFRIVNYNKLLFPQYLNDEHFPSHEQLLKDNIKRLSKKAKKLLQESPDAHKNVVARWKAIVKMAKSQKDV